MRLTLVTWNLNARRDSGAQVRALCEYQPDVVTLQEVTRHSSTGLLAALAGNGYSHVVNSVCGASSGARKYGLVIASRFPIKRLETGIGALWAERVLAVRIRSNHDIAVVTTHIPPASSNGPDIKSSMLEAALQVARECSLCWPTVISGDFNAPQAEHDGAVMTWGQRRNSKGEIVVPRSPALMRQHLAEAAWFSGEFTDAFRSLHPVDRDFSWVLKRSTGDVPRRFDHVFLSPQLSALNARYDHDVVELGLSDHAPLIVTLQLAEEPPMHPS